VRSNSISDRSCGVGLARRGEGLLTLDNGPYSPNAAYVHIDKSVSKQQHLFDLSAKV
jgi:hypothetical protein